MVLPLHARHDRTVAAVGQCHGRIRNADVGTVNGTPSPTPGWSGQFCLMTNG